MIIGIVGLADSGKGTVGDYLIDAHGFRPESFAKPVKDCCSAVFNWPRHLLEGDTKESRIFRETVDEYWSNAFGFAVTPRWAMQIMGTEAIRYGIHDATWIYSLDKRVEDSPYADFVVTDVRFPNEMKYIRSKGGVLLNTIRPPNPEWYDIAAKQNLGQHQPFRTMELLYPEIHISEWSHIGHEVDFTITNDGTLDQLKNKIDEVMQSVYKTKVI